MVNTMTILSQTPTASQIDVIIRKTMISHDIPEESFDEMKEFVEDLNRENDHVLTHLDEHLNRLDESCPSVGIMSFARCASDIITQLPDVSPEVIAWLDENMARL